MKKILSLVLLTGMILAATFPVYAEPARVVKGERTIAANEIIQGDLIFNGSRLRVNGTVQGDLTILSGDVTINGHVEGGITGLTTGKIIVNGTVNRDLRVLAREIAIKGDIQRAVMAGAVRFVASPDSVIGHGVYGAFMETILKGNINGSVDITSLSSTTLGGRIKGDFKGRGALLAWDAPLAIEGKVSDYSLYPFIANDPSGIKGIQVGSYEVYQWTLIEDNRVFKWLIMFSFVWFIGSLLFSLIFYRLFPRTAWKITEPSAANFRRSLIIGAICLFGTPLLIFLLISIIVGIPLAVFVLLFYVLLLLSFSVPVYLWFGRLVFKSRLRPGLMICLGAIFISVVTVLPFIGTLLQLMFVMVGMGMIVGNIKLQFKDRIDVKI